MFDKDASEKMRLKWESIKPDKEPEWMHSENPVRPFTNLTSSEAEALIENEDIQILDVRFAYEYKAYHIPEAILIPLPELEERYTELDPDKKTLVVCEHGVRSVNASCLLNIMGLSSDKIFNLEDGMASYRGKISQG